MRLAIITAHAGADCFSECRLSWTRGYEHIPVLVMDGRKGMLPAYSAGLESTRHGFDLLAYLHDDVMIHPTREGEVGWIHRIVDEFRDEQVGVVGFGGALGHGDPQLYKMPYDYRQLGRSRYMSNVDDAEVHGDRILDSRDVAVLDGFSLVVRRTLLEKTNGWPLATPISYIGYDYWLCCMARRHGYRIRVCGIPCVHLGGRTFVKQNMSLGQDAFLQAHEYIAQEFRDVLPFYTERA